VAAPSWRFGLPFARFGATGFGAAAFKDDVSFLGHVADPESHKSMNSNYRIDPARRFDDTIHRSL